MDINTLLNKPETIACLYIAIGAACFVICILKLQRFGKKECTIATKAMINRIDPGYGANSSSIHGSIKIRFATKDKDMLWINGTINDTTTPSLFNVGEEIDILYNEANPNDFVVVSGKQDRVYIIGIVVGFVIIVFGAWKLFQTFP